MLNQLLKKLADLIAGTGRFRRKFEQDNPSEKVLVADASKGIVTTNQEVTRGAEWVTSQRAIIILTEKRIVCGKWNIPLDTIETAQLVKINSMFGGGQVLKIRTVDNVDYQFGMQLNPDWLHQKQFPLTLEKGRIKYSPFSIVIRIAAIGYLLYWIYNRFIF